jgi:hypothetical protein
MKHDIRSKGWVGPLRSPVSDVTSAHRLAPRRLLPWSLHLGFLPLLILLCSLPSTRAADFYVATDGNDSNLGTETQPFASLEKARDAGRKLPKTTGKRIILRGGSYYNVNLNVDGWLDGNITFMPYPGEAPVLYGGQPLTNWVSAGNGSYASALPAFPTNVTSAVSALTNWQPRMLLADGVMCARARLPQTGKYHYQSLSNTTLTYTNDFPATTNMELIIDNSWNDAEMMATGIDSVAKTITLNGTVSRGPNTAGVRSFALVNLPEGMTQDNQFWWDKTNNMIVYRPPAGQDPNAMTIIVPSTTRMFYLRGQNSPNLLNNIVFSNLSLSVVNVTIGSGGQDDFGTGYNSAIAFVNCSNLVVDSCSIYAVAGYAIKSQSSLPSLNSCIKNCIIHDVGVGGVSLSGTTDGIASHNIVYNTGLLCQAGPGIVGSTYGARVDHNTITNCSGAGIVATYSSNAVVSFNRVVRCVKALRDMAGIYTEGVDITVYGNYIAEVNGTNSDNGGAWDKCLFGIYCDFGSIRPTIASNITYNCTRPFIYHMATNGVYVNNFYINTRDEDTVINFHNADRTVVFQRNIFVSHNRTLVDAEDATYKPFSLSANAAVADWHSNLFWSTGGFNSNNPTNVVTADPLLQSLKPLQATYQPDSTAAALGIMPLELKAVGHMAQQPLAEPTGLHLIVK